VRKFFLLVAVVLVALVLVVVVGPTLPEGNPIRAVGESLRDFGQMIGDGFGGGYQPITPSS